MYCTCTFLKDNLTQILFKAFLNTLKIVKKFNENIGKI